MSAHVDAPETFEVIEESLLVHASGYNWHAGKLTIKARASGRVEFQGRIYEFDRVIRIRTKREMP